MPRKTKRQLAALKGWETRRAAARARSRAAKKGWKKRRAIKLRPPIGRPPKKPVNVAYVITIKFTTRPRRGMPPQEFKRDLVIYAKPGATFRDLKRIATETLPERAQPLLEHFKRKNVVIAEGDRPTAARIAKER